VPGAVEAQFLSFILPGGGEKQLSHCPQESAILALKIIRKAAFSFLQPEQPKSLGIILHFYLLEFP
jgi:hypothetical protein